MTYKIAICDDCPSDIKYLSVLVSEWAERANTAVTIKEFPSAEAFLFHYENQRDFDILLLDIEMTGQNGIDLAKKVRQDNKTVQIVFITGFPDFVAEGYDVAALHYLMKPVAADKLYTVLDRAADNLSKSEKRLKVSFDRQNCFLPLNSILYIEAQKQYIAIHTFEEVYRMKASLTELEGELDQRFMKCQRSYVVNLDYVVRVRSNCVILKNGEEIPISRGMAEAVGKAIIQLYA